MNKLQINTGEIKLEVVNEFGESRGVFSFNPYDVQSSQRFIEVQREYPKRVEEFQRANESLETAEERVENVLSFCQYFRDTIDYCFGAGSSNILFGDANTIEMFIDFFEGITPYYEKASNDRISKYNKKSTKNKGK